MIDIVIVYDYKVGRKPTSDLDFTGQNTYIKRNSVLFYFNCK